MNQERKSTFVTVLAWLFIAYAGLTVFISILQNIMIHFMFPMEEMNEVFHNLEMQIHIPLLSRFLYSNIKAFFLVYLVISAITLISAIGLLKRNNWARIMFIVIMSLGILWNLSGFFMQLSILSSMPIPEEVPEEFTTHFTIIMNIMKYFTLLIALGMSILLGWIIKKLASDKIKSEFMPVVVEREQLCSQQKSLKS